MLIVITIVQQIEEFATMRHYSR